MKPFSVLARNSKLTPFGPNWENLEVASERFEDLHQMTQKHFSRQTLAKIFAV